MRLRMKMSAQQDTIKAELNNDTCAGFILNFGEVVRVTEGLDPYTGEYVITPKVYEQVLEVNGKTMIDDLTFLKIPRQDVGNEFGKTCVIGG